ncbi:MAG: phosphate ABC transporter ATP-binding protein [Chloroflexi bacterium]|nr:phosphate ABC transporter ATP-binding protein [Chloroflexota bacterium]
METPAKIELQHVHFAYEDHEVLHDINLRIPPNQIFVLFGPAGSGKSTLLRLLNRLTDFSPEETHLQGKVLLDGQDIFAPDVDVTRLRQRAGMVFAKPVPLPLSIRDNITYGLTLGGRRDRSTLDETVERSLHAAALWDEVKDRLDDPGMALSGGQQQRLCLARTLALQPEVVLLDEPTSGLDPISTLQVEEALFQLRESVTFIVVPHSVQQAARVADRAAFLLMGELVEEGPADVLFTRPKDKRTEDYVTGRFG